eukprot:6602902-Prymnesium_polylepis.1
MRHGHTRKTPSASPVLPEHHSPPRPISPLSERVTERCESNLEWKMYLQGTALVDAPAVPADPRSAAVMS